MALAKVREQRQKQNEYKLEVDRIQAQLDSRMIFAPIDGVVSEIHRRKGEYIASSAPQYATIVRFNELIARFYLLESEVRQLAAGNEVNLRVRAGDQEREVKGTVKFVSPVTDSDSGTARVEVLIENSDQQIRSGSPCQWLGRDRRSVSPGEVVNRE
jgi:multidrug efflux pump subunit AcrA (membrane-fusion protein)